MSQIKQKPLMAATLALVLAAMLLPWLGDTLYNTKGEPREALVALSMINSGNFILPESYGADIPYKPPMLAWLIAGSSWLMGGISEAASRLPSALATIALVMATFLFFARSSRRTAASTAMITALVTITSVEVWRAAAACRVDMVLTAATVIAIYAMVDACERAQKPVVSWWGVLMMSVAVLTKGPVGMVLPCLVVGIYLLFSGRRVWTTVWTLALSALASLVVPALWYFLAWQEGGERFLALALEENLGRFTGSMTYDSHLNPWWYNPVTILAGMAPYTLLALIAIAGLNGGVLPRMGRPSWRGFTGWMRSLHPFTRLALVACVTILVFYTIPASKRSVYLLPMYPFMAYFVALMCRWMVRHHPRLLTIYATVIASAALIVAWATWGFHMVEPTMASTGAHDAWQAIYDAHFGMAQWAVLVVTILVAALTLIIVRRRGYQLLRATLASTVMVYITLSGVVLPPILNAKSDIVIAQQVKAINQPLKVYSYNNVKMLRYYTTAFYLNDSIRLFAPEEGSSQSIAGRRVELPDSGLLIVNTADMPLWQRDYAAAYTTDTLWTGSRRSCDCRVVPMIVKFTAK